MTREDQKAVINAYRSGNAARIPDALVVGLDGHRSTLRAARASAPNRSSLGSCLRVVGPYGSGKSVLENLAAADALQANFALARLTLRTPIKPGPFYRAFCQSLLGHTPGLSAWLRRVKLVMDSGPLASGLVAYLKAMRAGDQAKADRVWGRLT